MKNEQMKNVNTADEMRAEIFWLQHHDPLVRNVMDAANYTGINAEDRYTKLAYNALQRMIHLQDICLNYELTHITKTIILD